MISLIFLAGGKGQRMGANVPKQYLPLNGRPLALHSLEVFLSLDEIDEVIVVCAPQYRCYFSNLPVRFASPGDRRQDSVYQGFLQTHSNSEWIMVHDGARPFITQELVKKLLDETKQAGAGALGMPVKQTLKATKDHTTIFKTLDRSSIWEIQTPQLLKKEILQAGFEYALAHDITVTDDVSLAELIGHPAKLIPGSYKNIKITTPEDLAFARWLKSTNSALATTEQPTVDGKSNQMPLVSKD